MTSKYDHNRILFSPVSLLFALWRRLVLLSLAGAVQHLQGEARMTAQFGNVVAIAGIFVMLFDLGIFLSAKLLLPAMVYFCFILCLSWPWLLNWQGHFRASKWTLVVVINSFVVLLSLLFPSGTEIHWVFLVTLFITDQLFFNENASFYRWKILGILPPMAFFMIEERISSPGLKIELAASQIILVRDLIWLGSAALFHISVLLTRQHNEESKKIIKEAHSFNTELIKNIPIGVYTTDSQGKMNSSNPFIQNLFGDSPRPGQADDWLRLVDLADRRCFEVEMQKIIKGKSHKIDLQLTLKRTDGSKVYLQNSTVAFQNSQGLNLGYIGTLIDITKQKEAQKTLVESSKMSSLGEMAAGVAHEINNPLAIILGKVQQLKKFINQNPINPDLLQANLDKIELTSIRISKIVKGLQVFSRSSEGDPMESVDLWTLAQDTLELFRERFKMQAIDCAVKIDAELRVLGRPSELSQVIVNLLSNSCDAIAGLNEKWLEIEAKVIFPATVIISVTDSGLGIPEPILEKIMHPFFTTKEVGKGTGLGLSISSGIIANHGGRLSYDTSHSHTRFLIELPLDSNRAFPDPLSNETRAKP